MPEVFTISSPLTLHDMWCKVAPGNQVHLCFQSILVGKSEIHTLYQHTTAVVKLELAETLSLPPGFGCGVVSSGFMQLCES